MTVEEMKEQYPNVLLADGLDKAIVGLEMTSMRVIYSVEKAVAELERHGMTNDEAIEYFEYNVQGANVGERTPIWCFSVDQ